MPIRSTVRIACGKALRRGQPCGVDHVYDRPKLGGEGVDGGLVGDVDVGCLAGEPAVCHFAGKAEVRPNSTLCRSGAIPPLLVEMAGRCPASSGSPAPAMTVACREVRRPRGHSGRR